MPGSNVGGFTRERGKRPFPPLPKTQTGGVQAPAAADSNAG